MASFARQVMQDVLTALRQTHEHVDLATVDGTQRVVIDAGEPPVLSAPWVVLSPPEIPIGHSAVTPLTQYEEEGTFEWWGFVASDLEDTTERALDALDLANDVVKALQTAHTQPATYTALGVCLELIFGPIKISGAASIDGIPYGVAYGSVTYKAIVGGGI